MRKLTTIKEKIKEIDGLFVLEEGIDGLVAMQEHTLADSKNKIVIVFSYGGGWEHASVSFLNRIPTWEEMCMVKDIFWHDEESVVQFHPPKSEYVNKYPNCLHLWKKIGSEFELPPKEFVG